VAKLDEYLVSNPTPKAIESAKGKVKVEPGQVKLVTIDDEKNSEDLVEFICKGCTVAPASKANASFTTTDVLDNVTQLVEKGAHQLEALVRAVESAAGNTFAEKGL